jgi:hypothetical protein
MIAAAALLASVAASSPTPCAMLPTNRTWIDHALANWSVAESRLLKLAPQPLPRIYAVDAKCTYTLPAGSRPGARWRGTPHGHTVALPGGAPQPLGPISFAATDTVGKGFFAMSLPSVWRAAGIKSGLGLESLMDGVMLHELMHARQFYFVNPTMAELTARYHLPDTTSDDSLQAHFAKQPGYEAAYVAERDALFAAAAAPDAATARSEARRALGLMRERRARWFTGDDAYWTDLDDLFLTMEGLGQWLAYSWTLNATKGQLPTEKVLAEVRRDGAFWTQDEGLALFLTVDRLVPGWQKQAFAAKPALAESLLIQAAR